MKKILLSSILAAGACAMFNACSDDSPSPLTPSVAASSSSVDWLVGSSSSVDGNSDLGSSSSVVPGSSASNSSSSVVVPPNSATSSSNDGPSQSSSSVNPTSSATPNSSAVESSSSAEPELGADGFPTLESYGPPPAEYTKDISATAKRGWNTRYWDACKPHCSWLRENANDVTRADTSSDAAYIADYGTARNCNIRDVEVPTFTLGDVSKSWFGYNGTRSACGDNEMENNPPRETHKALKGKHMIVMASNIGNDVAGGNANLPAGQFDLMVPGGGVGAFDALTVQVNKGRDFNWGAGFGGFLTECQNKLGYDATLAAYQTCIKDMCDAAFGDAGLPNLLRGCHWFADWYKAADNPTYYIEEVECPQYLIDHYMSRFNTTTQTNIKKVTDWSTYKEGDVLDTLHCWKAGEAPPENGWQNPSAGCDVK